MPINKIEINEYECLHCGYKWINKINYRDGSIPTNCAKCKRLTWNHTIDRFTPQENGYRRIVRGFKKLYDDFDTYTLRDKGPKINWPADLCDQFLNMNPKPSYFELEYVIRSSPLKRFNNGKAIYRRRGWVPDLGTPGHFIRDPSTWEPIPEKPGYVRWKKGVYDDPKFVSLYDRWIMKEAHVRKKMMIIIMKHRGVEYRPVTDKGDSKNEKSDKYMSREEKLWRRRINEFQKYVRPEWLVPDKDGNKIDARIYTNWPLDLCKRFFSIKPRPTVEEMKDIFYSPVVKGVHKLDWDDKAEAGALFKKMPTKAKDGYIAHDLLRTIRHKKLMIKVIESRGEKYSYNEELNLKILQDQFPIKANK